MRAEILSSILNQLMQGPPAMSDSELSRCTGVAINTIRRMASGQSHSPRRASLEPIAEFFDVSVSQLVGDEPIKPMGATLNHMERNALKRLREIWQAKAARLSITAEKAALAMGYKNQKVVHRFLSGKIALNIDVVFKFAQLLHVEPTEILAELPNLEHLGLSWWDGKERRGERKAQEKKSAKWDGVDRRNSNRPSRTLVPMLKWDEIPFWRDIVSARIPGDGSKWVPTPVSVSSRSYAVKVTGDSMLCSAGYSFSDGCVIVVDPEASAQNGSYLLASPSETEEVVFRQLIIESDGTYLVPQNESFTVYDVSEGYMFYGTVKAMFQLMP